MMTFHHRLAPHMQVGALQLRSEAGQCHNDTRPDLHMGCQAVMEGVIVFASKLGLKPVYYHPVGRPWFNDAGFYEMAARAQMVIVNGEGSIHHANDRAQNLARIGPLCKRTLRIPSILLNATFYKNTPEIYELISDFDVVSVRDTASRDEAAKFGIKDIVVCPDFSLFHNFETLKASVNRPVGSFKTAGTAPRVGITDSILESTTKRLNILSEKHKYINCNMGNSKKIDSTIYDYARKLANLDFFISGRFHGICYSINVGTPFIAIESNTPKISFMLKDIFGSSDRVLTIDEIEALSDERFRALAEWSESASARSIGRVYTPRRPVPMLSSANEFPLLVYRRSIAPWLQTCAAYRYGYGKYNIATLLSII